MTDHSNCSRRAFLQFAGATAAGSLAERLVAADAPKVPTVGEAIAADAAAAPLSMKFPGGSADDCRKWQAAFGDKLRQLLGPHSPPKKWTRTTRGVTEFADHTREDLVLTAAGVPPLPVYLLLPKPKSDKRLPGIVALHGHGPLGHHAVAGRDDLPGGAKEIESLNYDYGRQLARRGYAVAVPCMVPFGERLGDPATLGKQDACADTFIRMQALGKLLIAENLRDCLWAVELLAAHDRIDANRLGCVGLSYGGRMTMLTTAIEPRIKVAVVSGALNVFQERISKPYGCGAQIVPGLLKYGDVPEIGSLIAPRPCLWEVGTRDNLIAAKWAEEAIARMKKAYEALSAGDQLQVDRFDGAHRWNGIVAYPLLDKILK